MTPSRTQGRRILFVQYGGDFRHDSKNIAAGGGETYYAQKYSIDSVAELVPDAEAVIVVCCMTSERYSEVLPNGVTAIGAGYKTYAELQSSLVSLIASLDPTHLIVRMPYREALDWGLRHGVRTLALFDNSLVPRGLARWLRAYQWRRTLRDPRIEWVGSYGIASAWQLSELGIREDKIIPWDFLVEASPGPATPRTLPTGAEKTLLFVGALVEDKGVGDTIEALAKLRAKSVNCRLAIAGVDREGTFAARAKSLGVESAVDFLGLVANASLEPLMREYDLVIVPSRHNFPEGFPLVMHHAFRACTPIVASDHPMFRRTLKHRENSIIFRAGDVSSLADKIEEILSDADLYAALSSSSHKTWLDMRLPVQWADIFQRWLEDTPAARSYLGSVSLASPRYRQ